MSKGRNSMELSKIIFIGRTFDEYMSMFDLKLDEIKGLKILDAPGGACSFNSVANAIGTDVTSIDIAYYHSPEDLYIKGMEDITHAMTALTKAHGQYIWEYFENVNDLARHRREALDTCFEHMQSSPQSYIASTLPELPFQNDEFDLTLCAHFLFTYADRLDYEFHQSTISEYLRVTKQEVRIFPLVDLSSNRYKDMDRLLAFIQQLGWKTEEQEVDYEFQKNANSMLRIYR